MTSLVICSTIKVKYITPLDGNPGSRDTDYMTDAPMAEQPVRPTLENIAKPTPSTSVPEFPAPAPEKPPTPENAREALKDIATRPKPEEAGELGPDREKVDAMLSQGTQLLLDAGDKRATLTALAHQAASTPLGMELRRDVIQSIAEMKPDKLSPEQAKTLTVLQNDIAALNMPKTDPARSEFAKFLEEYSSQNSDCAIPASIIEAIRTNKLDRADHMANILQSDTTLSAKLNEQFKGDRTEPLANVATPEGLLAASGLPATAENTTKAAKLLEPPRPPDPKSLKRMSDFVMPTLMGVALVSMFMNQLTGSGEGGGQH